MSKLWREDSAFLGSYDQWIAFKEWSPGDHSSNETSGTIICTHGLGDTAGAFDVVGPLLAKENYRVLAIDLPGHGFSSHSGRYGLYQIAEAILRFVVALELKDEKLILISHSFSAEAAPFLTGTLPNLFTKIVQLDNPGPVDYRALTEDPFTGQPPATYQQKLERFYNLALANSRKKTPLYESIEAAARKRLTDVPKIFRLDVTAAMNISKRAYRQEEIGHFVPTQDPAVMRDNWPNGAAPNASRADIEALVASITAKCLLIKFDSWQEDFWTKAHQPLLEHYRECKIATVSGPHHAFAMKESGETCANVILRFLSSDAPGQTSS